jgi:hypothetical protein
MEKTAQQKRANDRHQKRVGKELNTTFQLLSDRFMDFFMSSEEPEGEEMVNYMKERSAQWITYCKRKNILPQFHNALDEFMNGVMKDYLASKEGK